MSLFCRHSRFVADCPICSKGTVLEGGSKPARRAAGGSTGPRAQAPTPTSAAFRGRYVSAGPYYDDDDGDEYEVRLERVPGGVRLAEWGGSGLRRRAPVLEAADLPDLVKGAGGVLDPRDASRFAGALQALAAADGPVPGVSGDSASPDPPAPASPGVSRGRSGDFKEELRVEPVGDGRLRIGRWVMRPASGWQLQEAPPMLPAARFAEAIADAARRGLVRAVSDDDAERP